MISGDLARMFPYNMDFHHFATVSRDTYSTYWVYDCLNRFEGILKMDGIYEAIWASRYKQQFDKELLKAIMARWSHALTLSLHVTRSYASLCVMSIK